MPSDHVGEKSHGAPHRAQKIYTDQTFDFLYVTVFKSPIGREACVVNEYIRAAVFAKNLLPHLYNTVAISNIAANAADVWRDCREFRSCLSQPIGSLANNDYRGSGG